MLSAKEARYSYSLQKLNILRYSRERFEKIKIFIRGTSGFSKTPEK